MLILQSLSSIKNCQCLCLFKVHFQQHLSPRAWVNDTYVYSNYVKMYIAISSVSEKKSIC